MTGLTSAHLDAARRLLALEVGGGATAPERAEAARRVFEKLRLMMDPLVGSAGVQAIMQRSWRSSHNASNSPPDAAVVEGATNLRDFLREQDAAQISETTSVLFGRFLALLTTFIGERLATEVLRRAWPALPEDVLQERTP